MSRICGSKKWLNALGVASAILMMSAPVVSKAQTISGATYGFTESSGASLEDMTGATRLLGMWGDDARSEVVSLPFDFWYVGTRHKTFSVTSNGMMNFGSIPAGTTQYTLTGTASYLAPYIMDTMLVAGGSVSYKTIGSAPNRKFVVQWSNLAFPFTFSANPAVQTNTCQAILNESTGVIEYVYGSGFGANSTGYGCGINQSATVFGSITVGGPSTISYVTANNANNAAIPSGTKFTFTPIAATAPTALPFTGTTGTGTTLNWTNTLATAFYGTAVFMSTDGGTTYRYLTQTGTGVSTLAVTGLGNNSTYHFRLFGVTESGVSSALDMNVTTTAGTLAGTQPVGASTGAPFDNLTNAFAHINANGLSGAYTLSLQADYNPATETYPLNVPAVSGHSTPLTISVGAGGPFTLAASAGADATANSILNNIINFNGADHVTINGGAGKNIIIENTATTTNPNTCALLMLNDAHDNTVTNVQLKSGARQTATANVNGVVLFGGTTGLLGNDRNTLSSSLVGPSGANLPTNGIVSINTNASVNAFNDDCTVSGNEVFDYFETGTAVSNRGILVGQGNSGWTVNSNKVYQTATRTFTTAGAIHSMIVVDGGAATLPQATGVTVTNNTLGFANNAGTGTWTYAGTVATRLVGIDLASVHGNSIVTGNTVSNLSLATSSGATTQPGILAGISTGRTAAGGKMTVSNNTIGASTADDQLVATSTTIAGLTMGIGVQPGGILDMQNNQVRGLTGIGTGTNIGCTVVGILNAASSGFSSNDQTVSNNTVGTASSAQSIRGTGTGTGVVLVGGIRNDIGNFPRGEQTIENNVVQGLTLQSPTGATSRVFGMQFSRGILRLRNNTVSNITGNTVATATANTAGTIGINVVCFTAATPANAIDYTFGNIIENNVVHSVSNTAATAATVIQGMMYLFNTPPTGTTSRNRISGNSVSNLTNTTTGAGAINGLYNLEQTGGGSVDVANNSVSLGSGYATSTTALFGIRENGNVTGGLYYNSVSISGTATGAGTSTTSAFLRASVPASGTDDFRNNVFVNTRTNSGPTGLHLSSFMNTGVGNCSADNNVYFGNGTGYLLGHDGTTPSVDLNAWQTNTPFDDNGAFGDPLFTSVASNPPDLDVTGCQSSVIGAGTDLTSVGFTTDDDGQARPALDRPDAGQDETAHRGKPNANPTAFVGTVVDCDDINVSFTANANAPDNYLVIRNLGSAEATLPTNFTAYTQGAAYGTGTVAYVGSAAGFSDAALSPADGNWFYTTYAYNGSTGCERYLTTTPLQGSAQAGTQEPTAQPASLAAGSPTTSSIDVSFPAAVPAAGFYVVLRKAGGAVAPDAPSDASTYTVGNAVGGSTVAFVGSGLSFTDSGLNPNTTYHYAVFSFNAPGSCSTNYLTTAPSVANATTLSSNVNDWAALENE